MAALGLGLVAGGVHVALTPAAVSATSFSATASGTSPAPAAGAPAAAPAAAAPAVASVRSAVPVASRPTRLRIPRLGVSAVVRPIGVDRARALALPPDPGVVGWYAGGARPGDATGSTVIAGHVDRIGYGRGALASLTRLRVGDRVELTRADGKVARYRVTSRATYVKASLPRSVFRLDGRPTLTLITCGGPFNSRTHHYRDNIVVTAVPTA